MTSDTPDLGGLRGDGPDPAGAGLKSRVLSGLFWKFAERLGVQGTQFLIQILLARMLFPEDYALVAVVSVIVLIWHDAPSRTSTRSGREGSVVDQRT